MLIELSCQIVPYRDLTQYGKIENMSGSHDVVDEADHCNWNLIQSNLKLIHSHIVSNHLSQRPPNKVLQDQTPSVSPAELLLSRETRRTLAQLRTNKSPLLVSYLFSIGDPRHPSPLCPLCLMHDHTSSHLFECKSLPTSLSSLDLWTNPDKVEPFLATWGERLLAATWFRVLDSAGSTLVEWGRQQQQQQL